jgi:hypothetical protein
VDRLSTLKADRAFQVNSALLVSVLAVAAILTIAFKLKARRRYAKMKVSGGRKALALNLFNRS